MSGLIFIFPVALTLNISAAPLRDSISFPIALELNLSVATFRGLISKRGGFPMRWNINFCEANPPKSRNLPGWLGCAQLPEVTLRLISIPSPALLGKPAVKGDDLAPGASGAAA